MRVLSMSIMYGSAEDKYVLCCQGNSVDGHATSHPHKCDISMDQACFYVSIEIVLVVVF